MRLWLSLSLLIVVLLAAVAYSQLPGVRLSGTFPVDPPTPYFHYVPIGSEHGRILVVHGLDANKEMMNILCYALAEAGFDVYSIDLPGHGDSMAGFNAVRARNALSGALDILGPHTIVIGHSLGGALLLDLANQRAFEKMVLLSPAPVPIDRIHAEQMLVLTGQFDLPRIRTFVPQLEGSGAGNVELRTIPWAGHSGYLFQSEPIREIVTWLGGTPGRTAPRRLGLLVSIILLALGLGILWIPGTDIAATPTHIPTTILSYIAGCVVAVLVCGVAVVMNGLQLFSTDYLISFVFLLGVTRLPSCFRKFSIKFPQILISLFAASYVLTVAGLVGSEFVHLTLGGPGGMSGVLSVGRWWRFIAIAIAVLPLSFADEVLLRPIRPWWKAAGLAALTRILIAAFAVTGVLTMNRSAAFLVLIIHFVVIFWIALWFAGELLRRRTQDPFATAIFTAVVQAWVFAAIFVLI